MTNFDADIFRELRDLQEVAIRTEKHPNTAVVIWVAVADEEVFVRSVRGIKGRWYRDLAAGGYPVPSGIDSWPASTSVTRERAQRCSIRRSANLGKHTQAVRINSSHRSCSC